MRTPKHHRRMRHPGFSLMEILIVTAIVLTLAMLSYSGTRRMITSSRIVASSANLRSLTIANATYLADHGTYCPAADKTTNRRWHGTRKSSGDRFDPTKGFLSPYLGKNAQVTACPLFRALVSGYEEGTGGYGYNAAYIGGKPGGEFDKATGILIPQRPANVANPTKTVMFTTTAYAQPAGLQAAATCEPPFWDYGNGPSGDKPSPTVHFRAHGKALVAWCDGSITAETKNSSTPGHNPHGGDAEKWNLGWFGPAENNGFWNPKN
jgi:prepilin-type N-terminal cleavage/methylation domain-containing protein